MFFSKLLTVLLAPYDYYSKLLSKWQIVHIENAK